MHQSWHHIVHKSFQALDKDYRYFLENDLNYFPRKFFNAFSTLPKSEVKTILFGQDPYPRVESANGYAFIDAAVGELFSPTGLSKKANRATSLRNLIKMQLVCDGLLNSSDTSQEAIAALDKSNLILTIDQLRQSFERNGVLLLNTALVFTEKKDTKHHVKAWAPFMRSFLHELKDENIELLLFGNIAKDIEKLLPEKHTYRQIRVPHPYNVDFITNHDVQKYFKNSNLLQTKA